MGLKLGILGATGNVGRELISILEQWPSDKLPIDELRLFGSSRSAGSQITFRGTPIDILDTDQADFDGLDTIISAANGEVSEKTVPVALEKGVKLVIDTDSYYRMDPEVPILVAGVNDHEIHNHKGIIAGSNCTTAQLILPIGLLHQQFQIKRLIVNTYQAISGAGKQEIDRLFTESSQCLDSSPPPLQRVSDDQIAFNLVPMISKLQDNGYSKEEMKVIWESRKILNEPELPITCTAVRVPVLNCHSMSVNVEFAVPTSIESIHEALVKHPFVQVWSDPSAYPMPIDQSQTEPVHVSRVRVDESQVNTFNMWIVADNLWIGAALNALRVAELYYSTQNL